MRVHLRFTMRDPDLCRWHHSIDGRMVSFFINSILSAELQGKIAYLPQTVSLSSDASPCDISLRVDSESVREFLMGIPKNTRSRVVREIIRKHLRAQTEIKPKKTSPFSSDVLLVPEKKIRVTVAPAKKKPKPKVEKRPPKTIEKPEDKPVDKPKEETEEEREMRMALIAMAGE